MKLYDISQEVFSCEVYPGDPVPYAEPFMRIAEGDECNISSFFMCAHNGTHIDAPYHFFDGRKSIEQLPLESTVGWAYVAEQDGIVTAQDAESILNKARKLGNGCEKRILIKGKAVVSEEAAAVFAQAEIFLLGNESQSVGDEQAPEAVHKILLGKDIVLLEGVCLTDVPEGAYILNAAPLKLEGFDGSPCRAVLIEL